MLKPKTIFFAVLILVVALMATIFVKARRTQVGFETRSVITGAINESFVTTGTLNFQNQAKLSSEFVSKVAEIYIKEGESVKKGQALLKLDDTQLQMELAHVQTQRERTLVEIARLEKDLGFKLSELKRNESLLEKGMVARQALDNLKAISESSQFQLVSAKKNLVQDELAIQQKKNLLNKTVIRAPLDGTVISIPIKIGETAIPSATSIAGSELMTITQSNAMIVDAQIAEYDINRVKVGQKAEIRPRSDPNQVFLGEVMRVANYINSATPMGGGAPAHTVAVKIQLDLNGTQLPSGLSCDVKLLQGSMPNAVLIPLAAVQYEETRSKDLYIKGTIKTYHVWRVKEGKAYKQAVELGFADEHMQEIRRGLQKDEEVIVGPTQLINTLKEGMAISTQFKKGV